MNTRSSHTIVEKSASQEICACLNELAGRRPTFLSWLGSKIVCTADV